MRQAYKEKVSKLLNEKVAKDFPKWDVSKCNADGKITLVQDDISVKLLYDLEENGYYIVEISKKEANHKLTNPQELDSITKQIMGGEGN